MNKRSQVYRRMSASYVLVVLLFIVIVFVGYVCSYRIIRKQAIFYNEKLLETIKSVCDSEMETYNTYLFQLNYRENVKDYLSRPEYESSSASYATWQMKSEMKDIRDSMGDLLKYCYGPLVYIKSENILLSDVGSPMSIDSFCNYYFKDAPTEDVYRVLQEEKMDTTIVCRGNTDHKKYILLHNYLIDNRGNKGKGMAALWLNLEALFEKINSVAWEKDVDWAIVSDSGEILLCSQWLGVNLGAEVIDTEAESLRIDGTEYLLDNVNADFYNWRYVLLTNKKNISGDATRMEIIYFICAFVLLLAGYESVRILLRLHYDPIKNLVAVVSEDTEEKIHNEYQFLERRMAGILSKHQDVQRTLSRSNQAIRDYLLEAMLTSTTIKKQELTICQEIYSKFVEGNNLVIISKLLETEEGSITAKNEEDKKLDRFILYNVCEEEIKQYFTAEILSLEEYVVVIVNLRGTGDDYTGRLWDIYDKLRDFLKRHYNLTICVFEGNPHLGVEGIRQSYLEACETEEYLKEDEEYYLRYEDIRKLPLRSYEYSFAMEERLYNAVRSGNENLAGSYVEIILKNNLGEDNILSQDLQNCLLYDIYGTLLKAAEGIGISNGEILAAGKLFERADIEEIRKFFNERIRVICEEVSGKEENFKWKKLCQSVLEYIHENYADPDLNLSVTAQHFNLTPGYLATGYKQQTGTSIADTIKEMRIEHSKVLLKEGYNVREIAEKVGYRESSTFIRFFKNYTGMTPSQMRELGKYD